ncbi:Cyp6g1 [Trypoxylus dichotomus]
MLFNRPELMIKCPELIRHVLVKDFSHFQDRTFSSEEDTDDLSSNMIFFMKHPKWKILRSKTTPIFSSKNLRAMYPEMQKATKSLIDFINTKNNKLIEIMNLSAKYTTQAGFMAAFGVDSKSFQDIDTPLVSIGRNSFKVTFSSIAYVLCHHWKCSIAYICKPKLIRSSIAKFLKNVFIGILEERRLLNYHRGDFVDFLIKLKDESNLRDNEIVAQASQFLMAGYESTNVTISLALYELALNKCIQNKLREEVLTNLDDNGDLSYEILNTMDYLDKIIYETLRKYPIFPGIGRTCTKDYRIPNTAIVIEKGVAVIISLSGMHHDPKYFPDPEVFDPERFATDNVRRRHPYAFLPFGEGQRNCIGQRLGLLLVKLGVAYVIKSFEIDVCRETMFPLEFDPKKFNLSVNGGIYIQFTKID